MSTFLNKLHFKLRRHKITHIYQWINNYSHYFGYSIISFFTFSYLLLTLNRYWQFQYFFTDNVYFHRALWQVSQFKQPIVYHHIRENIHIFADHFHPVIFLLSLPLRLFQANEVIFIAMCLLYGGSAVFAMMVGCKLVKNKIIVLSLLVAYFSYLGVQNAMIFGFHEIFFSAFFFMMMVYAYFYNKNFLYWSSFFLLLLTKETMPIVTIAWSIFILLTNKNKRNTALMSLGISIVYFILIIKLVIPSFGAPYLYFPQLPSNIHELVAAMTEPKEKVSTFLVSIASFGFLPLLSIAPLVLVFQDLVIRYIFGISGSVQYTLEFHYGIMFAPLLFFGSIWSISEIEKKIKNPGIVTIVIAVFIIVANAYLHLYFKSRGALQMVFIPDFYKITKDNAFIWELLSHVPKDGIIVTQNHLGLALSDREVYLFPKDIKKIDQFKPKYIVYDTREGQSPSYFIPFSEAEYYAYINQLRANGKYKIYYQNKTFYILTRK